MYEYFKTVIECETKFNHRYINFIAEQLLNYSLNLLLELDLNEFEEDDDKGGRSLVQNTKFFL